MEFSEADRVAYRNRFVRSTVDLDDDARDIVRGHKSSASAYVWGWQDAQPGIETDTLTAEIFGYAYATCRALYMLDRISMAPSISWGWVKFRETGHVTESYNGADVDLDLVSPFGTRMNA